MAERWLDYRPNDSRNAASAVKMTIMNLVWTWWGIPGTFAFVVAWCCAIVALRTASKRQLNRRLSLILFLEGTFFAGHIGLLFFFNNQAIVTALATLGMAARIVLPFQYLAFLALALDSPLVVPFRTPVAKIVLNVASVAAAIVALARPGLFFSDLYSPGWAPWNFQFVNMGLRVVQFQGVVYIFGLVAALSTFVRTEKGSITRNRAMWFAIAFGLRDIYAGIALLLYPVIRPVPFWGDFIYNPGQAVFFSCYILLLAYAVLHSQLFDIDLRIRWTIKQSTLAAAVVAIVFLLSEGAERLLSAELGDFSGLMAAAIVVFFLAPLQRMAEHVASVAMPNTQDTPEYAAFRKMQVYEAAVAESQQEGGISRKERALLNRLRDSLGISASDAEAIEGQLQARLTAET
jgi:hypothetical protein